MQRAASFLLSPPPPGAKLPTPKRPKFRRGPFQPETMVHDDGYPLYRRRDNGIKYDIPHSLYDGQSYRVTNEWVVPHAHICFAKFMHTLTLRAADLSEPLSTFTSIFKKDLIVSLQK